MTAASFDMNDLERRMRGVIESLKREFGGLRTGRASANLLDPVVVTVYGAKMPLNQVATVSVSDARTISVQVWDKSQVGAGLNPIVDGTLLRLPVPALNAERRQELVKLGHKYAEHARVGVRNVRRDGMDVLKKLEKDHKISEDEQRKSSTKVQELTDRLIKDIDQMLAAKEVEIKQV